MGKRYIPGTTASRVASAIKPKPCATRVGKPASKSKSKTSSKTVTKKTSEVKPKEGITTNDIKVVEEAVKQHSGIIKRPTEVGKSWFTIAVIGGKPSVLEQGTQLECLEVVADFVESNSEVAADLYIANGIKLISSED